MSEAKRRLILMGGASNKVRAVRYYQPDRLMSETTPYFVAQFSGARQ
jgi:hypothetical protein